MEQVHLCCNVEKATSFGDSFDSWYDIFVMLV